MKFNQRLNEYIEELQCSAKELAEASRLSATVVSRYRTGERVPAADSEQLQKLASGIVNVAQSKGKNELEKEIVFQELADTLKENDWNYDIFLKHFNAIILVLNINIAEMARGINYDASYISRIRSGQRHPANMENFIENISQFIVKRYNKTTDLEIVAPLLNVSVADIEAEPRYLAALLEWFYSEEASQKKDDISEFLKQVDEFDLDEYIKAIHFDEMKVPPALPVQLPTSKNYYGLEAMKTGTLDFLKATVMAKSMEDVYMLDDTPIADKAKDSDFPKKWMFGIAMVLKKGLHIHMVHNLNRPFEEMMLGLEAWIPLYMTGQVSPYYLKGVHNQIFGHFLYTSGVAALSGECIADYHDHGKYYLTKNRTELSYYRQRSKDIISQANPLMEIYRKAEEDTFQAFLNRAALEDGSRHELLSALPIYTISDDLLVRMLQRNGIDNEEQQQIIQKVNKLKCITEEILKKNPIRTEIPEPNKKEFQEHPMRLSLSETFYEREIVYTFEEYLEHLEQTEKFAEIQKNYSLLRMKVETFRNIQITIHEGKWAMVSKNKCPAIHFVIRHPKLCNALENMVTPMIEP